MHKNFFKVVFMRDPTTCRIILKEEENEKHQAERRNFQNLSDTTSQEEEQSELYSTLS